MQTGLAMARHLGEAPNLNQGLFGLAIGAVMLNQMEALVQAPDAPNLYRALQELPKPLVDLTKTMELEIANLRKYNFLLRRQFEKQLKPAHDRVRLTMNRLDRHVAALQCVEALRLYAGAHKDKFPNTLTEITKIPIPNDPVTQKPFVYSRTGSKAVVEAPAPKGAKPKDAMRYDLILLTDTSGQSKYTPDAVELLRRYRQSLSWQESVSMKVVIESRAEIDGQRTPTVSERTFTFRRDHQRAEWLGKKLEKNDNNVVDLDKCQVIKTIMNGDTFARLTSGLDRPPIGALINRDKEFYSSQLNKMLCHPTTGGPLWGRMVGNNQKNVADLLIGLVSVNLHKNRENINGSVCYVVEAITRYGKVTAWIAPEKGYNALKWSIQKEPGDLFNDGPVTVSSWLAEFVADDLQKVGDFWVTKVGCLTFSIGYGDEYPIKTKTTKHKYQVSDIQIDPDFEALEAFKIDFPDGTPVRIAEAPGIRYVWQDGKPVRRK
jgi:hypothetical protein